MPLPLAASSSLVYQNWRPELMSIEIIDILFGLSSQPMSLPMPMWAQEMSSTSLDPTLFEVGDERRVGDVVDRAAYAPPVFFLRPASASASSSRMTALRSLGRPATNVELAVIMGCSEGEASKRAKACGGTIVKERDGRTVRLSLPQRLH